MEEHENRLFDFGPFRVDQVGRGASARRRVCSPDLEVV